MAASKGVLRMGSSRFGVPR